MDMDANKLDTGMAPQASEVSIESNPELVLAWYFGVSEEAAREMMPADTGDTLTFRSLPPGDA